MKFGAFDLHIISDGFLWLDGGAMFGVVPRTLWEQVAPPDDKNRICLALNCLLVQTPEKKKVLIDTGIGAKFDQKTRAIYNIRHETSVTAELEKLGIKPEQIDFVINTHLHFDHAGSNTRQREDGMLAPTFPNATYMIRRGEWDSATAPNERSRASYVPDNWTPLLAHNQVRFVDDDGEVLPGISLFLTPGHVKCHQSVMITSNNNVAVFLGDAIPTTHHLKLPWIMSYDLYPVDLIETKRKLIDQAVVNRWLLFFYHDKDTRAAYLLERQNKIVTEPVTTDK